MVKDSSLVSICLLSVLDLSLLFSTVITEVLFSLLSSRSGCCGISAWESSIETSVSETVDWFPIAFLSPVLTMVVFSSEFASSSFSSSPSIIALQLPKSAASISLYRCSASSGIPSDFMTSFCFFRVSLILDVRTFIFPKSF